MEEKEIGKIGNYYGGLYVRYNNGRYEWSIENYDGHHWCEITKKLYDELIQHQEELERR